MGENKNYVRIKSIKKKKNVTEKIQRSFKNMQNKKKFEKME